MSGSSGGSSVSGSSACSSQRTSPPGLTPAVTWTRRFLPGRKSIVESMSGLACGNE
jgi:hypothetical protein